VEYAISQKAMPGCQILIAKKGDVIFNQSYGYHTYKNKQKVKNSDVYDLASITKIAASAPAIMKLVDEKNFDLDNSLGDYLDLVGSNKDTLKIRDVLSHQARLVPWIPFYRKTLVEDSENRYIKLRDTLYSKFENDTDLQPEIYIYDDDDNIDVSVDKQIYLNDETKKQFEQYVKEYIIELNNINILREKIKPEFENGKYINVGDSLLKYDDYKTKFNVS